MQPPAVCNIKAKKPGHAAPKTASLRRQAPTQLFLLLLAQLHRKHNLQLHDQITLLSRLLTDRHALPLDHPSLPMIDWLTNRHSHILAVQETNRCCAARQSCYQWYFDGCVKVVTLALKLRVRLLLYDEY
eukprot:GHUV01012962.1.p2 GENE.GHUV01012962.1~~GHUV01012962.1.p2  ORF type:complete len:130 (-),score=8.28 GHUV01012962.1:580-969(-)